MILTTEDIGKVFRLKRNKFYWCIPIQENIIFSVVYFYGNAKMGI